MKKIYLFLLTLGCATATHNSFTMMQMMRKILRPYTTQPTFDNSKILISKKSAEKIQMIRQDYQTMSHFITNKSKELNLYKKPSDLINDLSHNKSIRTKQMSPTMVFYQNDIDFLDQRFKETSMQHGSNYAWSNVISLMHTKL
jgi:hypothetical protein